MTRTRWITATAAVCLAGGLVAWRISASRGDEQFRYETAAVERGRVVARVTATGTLSALVTVQVGSQVSGRIASLHADFNSRVKKGQVIAKLDPQLFQAAVEQARANVMAAEGNLARAEAQAEDARRQLRRTRELAERKLVAAADLDTAESGAVAAEAGVKSARGALAQARASLSQAQVNLAYTTIVSPTDGVVISRSVDVGQTVAASLQAPTLFVIAEDLAKMQVNTSVAESDVGRLEAGMPATFRVDAFPGRVFRGTVRQVRNAATTVQNVVTYDAVVDVDNPDLALRPGMTATVTFVYAEREDALRVPNAALRFRPPAGMPGATTAASGNGAGPNAGKGPGANGGGRGRGAPEAGAEDGRDEGRAIWVLRAGQPVQVRVRTGVTDGTSTEVLDGELKPGDQVLTDASDPSGKSRPAQGGGGGGAGGGRRGGPPRLF
ncbi:MAG TPA: efflux RND transporter periplasmic adaptor subunit [Anaeromyxobacter sp.]|nr:efflux RND transporter periplasmic adaptor subunit [Anaeromyxobacter sp.]